MNVHSDDVRNIWVEGSSYWGDNTFMELLTQKIPDKKRCKTIAGGINEIKVIFQNITIVVC